MLDIRQVYEKGISFVIDTNEDRQYSDLEITTEDTQQGLGIIIIMMSPVLTWTILHFSVGNFVQFKDSQNFMVYIGLLGKFLLTIKRESCQSVFSSESHVRRRELCSDCSEGGVRHPVIPGPEF